MTNHDGIDVNSRRLLDLEEVSNWLRISRDVVYRMSRSGELPAFKVGGSWRFRAEDVEACLSRWLKERTNNRGPETSVSSVTPTDAV
jgi:excisionase family DNA binding protein